MHTSYALIRLSLIPKLATADARSKTYAPDPSTASSFYGLTCNS